jgi:cation transport regulator
VPYQSNDDLPEDVQDALPEHAQEIYREAFDSAWKAYDDAEDREGDSSREETAHAVAWSAVKEEYEKTDGKWQRKGEA